MNWMKFCLVAFIAVEVLQVVYLVRSRRNQNSRLFLQEKSEKMNEQLAFKDKQIEKEKEEKMILLAEKDKQMVEKDKQMAEKDKQMAEKDKQMAEKDKQIEKEKEEKAEMNKQINSLLLIAEVFGKNAEKEMKGV